MKSIAKIFDSKIKLVCKKKQKKMVTKKSLNSMSRLTKTALLVIVYHNILEGVRQLYENVETMIVIVIAESDVLHMQCNKR